MPADMINRYSDSSDAEVTHTSVWQIIWHYFIMNPSEREWNKISTNFLQMKTQRCENLVIDSALTSLKTLTKCKFP